MGRLEGFPGIPRDTGAESVGYIGGTTGGIPRDSGAESVGYIGEVVEEEKERGGCHFKF